MPDLSSLSPQLDAKKSTCRAIIETPKGCRNKFDYDPDSGLFMLGGLLPEGMMFPFDFGFIPSTLGGDGDPLDILVLMDAPAHVGCPVLRSTMGFAVRGGASSASQLRCRQSQQNLRTAHYSRRKLLYSAHEFAIFILVHPAHLHDRHYR